MQPKIVAPMADQANVMDKINHGRMDSNKSVYMAVAIKALNVAWNKKYFLADRNLRCPLFFFICIVLNKVANVAINHRTRRSRVTTCAAVACVPWLAQHAASVDVYVETTDMRIDEFLGK